MKLTKSESGKLGALALIKNNADRLLSVKEDYNKNPVICVNCGLPHSYERRKNKFCSRTCSATFNNSLRGNKDPDTGKYLGYSLIFKCLNCGDQKSIGKNSKGKYCNSSCQQEFQTSEKIENGTASSKTLKRHLIKTLGYKCSSCNLSEWLGKPITLELEHIDGNSENNQQENLTLLCPNCHSQTDTYKAKNKGNGRHSRMKRYRAGKSF